MSLFCPGSNLACHGRTPQQLSYAAGNNPMTDTFLVGNMVLSSLLGFSSFGSSFYTAVMISINAKINLGRGETFSLFLLLFLPPLGAPVWDHPTAYFLSPCDFPVWAHSSKPWLSENHGLGQSRGVPVPQYFTRLPFLFCNLVHKELNSFFLTFIWQVFSQQTVRHNGFADVPLLSWFGWVNQVN